MTYVIQLDGAHLFCPSLADAPGRLHPPMLDLFISQSSQEQRRNLR